MSVPLILDIIRSPLEAPVRQRTTALELSLQAFTVRAQLCIRPILASDLEAIIDEFVGYIARVLDDLQGQRFHLEDPAVAEGQGAAELVVVRVVDGIVAVTAVDHGVDEMTLAVGRIPGALGLVRWVIDGKAEVVDGALVVSGRRLALAVQISGVRSSQSLTLQILSPVHRSRSRCSLQCPCASPNSCR